MCSSRRFGSLRLAALIQINKTTLAVIKSTMVKLFEIMLHQSASMTIILVDLDLRLLGPFAPTLLKT